MDLQTAYNTLAQQQKIVSSTSAAAPEDPKLVKEKANKVADMMANAITKQMKWQ